ncbi:MAG: type II/IV secretion system protein [Gemmataceae bacterium]|nr:type II/IV secretion system protein [Gemmataceae bacterium]
MTKSRGDFTEILIKKGILSEEQIAEARALQQQTGAKLQDALIKLGYASQEEIMSAIAEAAGMKSVSLEDALIPPTVIEMVPESVARENIVIPYNVENGVLLIVISDPSDYETIEKLTFILNKEIQPVLASKDQIIEAINKHYGQTETESVDSVLAEFTDTQIDFTETEATKAVQAGMEESEAPIIKLCNLIILEAISLRGSDIHIEPFEDRIRIRYRIDGIMVERDSPPRRLLAPMISRFKIMASMDISEKRRPQDGRIKMTTNNKHFDLRVSALPTNHGQSIVMRVLDRANIQVSVKDLGFAEDDYKRFLNIIKRPNGIFLVTGPTGSGKTTTLYSAINEMNRPDKKIITAEDPVEYYLPGISQCEVKHKIGLTFAKIIKSMLRQAPNIILVGEIRDHETAEIAVQASLTGHLVFSTLHTNDAPSAITRLNDIGVAPFLTASSVIAVLAQRLVRLVCPKCKEPDKPPAHEIKAAGLTPAQAQSSNFTRGRGCGNCNHTGYRGRKGIYEMMRMSNVIRELTFNREPAQAIRRQARIAGMRTLLEDGVNKAVAGMTTLEEVLSSCHHE